MKYSVMIPHAPSTLETLTTFADLAVEGLAHRLWLGQAVKVDPHQLFSHLSGSGRAVRTGTAVTLVPLRHPYEAALQARSVSMLSGRSHVAGFGAGSQRFVEALTGAGYAEPLAVMREYLTAVRALLAGETVMLNGEHVTLAGRLVEIDEGSKSSVEVGAGVLRAGMARVAGACADVAITWLTPPSHIENTLIPALLEGAEKAGRTERPRIVSVVHVILERPDRDPVFQVLRASSQHLSMPHYQRMLQSANIPIDPTNMVQSSAQLIESGVYCYGDAESIVDQLSRWADAGVDEVAINVAGTLFTEDEAAAGNDLHEILSAARHA
jgi:5,10-methylenetetrahydromethanopterin reductase